jgi:SAM-dependent methyltransferase
VSLKQDVVCPRCAAVIDPRAQAIVCPGCAQEYGRVGGIPVLLPRPGDQVRLWRQQLGLLVLRGQEMQAGLTAQSESAGLLPSGRARLKAMAEGARNQLADIVGRMSSALGRPLEPSENSGLPRGVVEYSYCLYRDWGWDGGAHSENEQAMDAVRGVVGACELGRTLVVGAGGCRLAYDLHRLLGATETAVVDIDPFLFVVAEAVVRGEHVRMTEAPTHVHEMTSVARPWTLRAPAGPLGDDVFHFFFANGMAPPFRSGTFDTVVTPWFIDQVPTDLPAFLARVRGVLKPGGSRINHGPLIYPADAPPGRRFSREEVFELASRAGFRIDKWSSQSAPHLVSPLSGRGKIEWVLTFGAVSEEK